MKNSFDFQSHSIILLFAFIFFLLIALTYGWIKNIIDIIHWHEPIGMLIARIAGIFVPPLGGVLGWF